MKKFKGKFIHSYGDVKKTRNVEKSFRKTGKNLLQFDPDTIFIPAYKRPKDWFW